MCEYTTRRSGAPEILVGGWGTFNERGAHTLRNRDVQPSKLIHPVKCSADPSSGSKALSWAGLDGDGDGNGRNPSRTQILTRASPTWT